MNNGVSAYTHTSGQVFEPSTTANVLIYTLLPLIVFSKYVFFQHMLPQKFDAVISAVRLDVLLTEIESTGIGCVISSSSNNEQAERVVTNKRIENIFI